MNTVVSRKNIIFILTSLLSLALLAIIFLPTTVQATNDNCTLSLSGDPADLFSKVEDGTLEFSHFTKSNGQAEIEITNNSNCEFPVALGAYKMSGNQLSDQTLSDEHQAVIPAHDSATLSVDLPSCMAEIDLFYDRPDDGVDGAPEVLSNSKPDFSVNLIGYTFYKNDQDVFAENDLFHFDNSNPLDEFPHDEDDSYQDAGPEENFCGFTPTLSGSCSATPSNPEINETVSWEASASGGTGNFTYSWSGAVSGSNQTETANYSSSGEKTATVTISSGDQQIERSCSINVKEKDDNGGGNGDNGDDNGDDEEFGQGGGGSPLPPRDDDDDGEVRGEQSEDFSVQCVPDRSSYLIGERVSLTAEIDGDVDEDDIDFSWSGNNRLNGDNEEATVQFLTSGTHTIEVEAELDGEIESDTCRINVRRGGSTGVTLDQIPYTGPEDTAKTIGFIAGLITLALAGGTLILRRREEGIPIGIPTDLS